MRHALQSAIVYSCIAILLTWPAAFELGESIPGADGTALWRSYWAIQHVTQSILDGQSLFVTDALNFPRGGTLVVNDLFGALIVFPFAVFLGPAVALGLLVIIQLAFAGWTIHMFSRDFLIRGLDTETPKWGPWISGLGLMVSSLVMSHVHNGATEALSVGWTVLAIWMSWRAAFLSSIRGALLAGCCLTLASIAHVYGGVVAFVFAAALLLSERAKGTFFLNQSRWVTLVFGLLLTLPIANGLSQVGDGKNSLNQPTSLEVIQEATRSTGSADPLVYVRPGRHLSPDFGKLPQQEHRYVHIHYLGLVGLSLTLWLLFRGRRDRYGFLLVGGVTCLVISLGPVWLHDGRPVIFSSEYAVPLPYFLLEGLPGFAHLNAPWKFALGPVITIAMMAGLAVDQLRIRFALIAAALLCLDARVLSPAAEIGTALSVAPADSIVGLASAPEGAVINYPLRSGEVYLYEQTVHGKPIAGTFSKVASPRAMRLWRRIHGESQKSPDTFHKAVSSTAKRLGIRYLVIHTDPNAEPDVYSAAVRKIEKLFPTPDWGRGQTRVVPLW